MEATAVTIDNHPMWVNLEPAYPELEGYPEAELDRKVLTVIACYANSQGTAFPLQATIADILGEIKMNVNRSVHRLIDKRLIKIMRKEKKYNDIHPRCIYGVASDMVRETPDMRSSHFDAEKWRVIAARLKKHVAKAVDNLKQVATSVAESMASARKRKPRAHGNRAWKQWRNKSYADLTVEEKQALAEEQARRNRLQLLYQNASDDLAKANVVEGHWLACRYMEKRLKKTPEQYDQILQDAIEKFKDYQDTTSFEGRVRHGLNPLTGGRASDGTVADVRLMSSEDEPKTLGGILGAAFA